MFQTEETSVLSGILHARGIDHGAELGAVSLNDGALMIRAKRTVDVPWVTTVTFDSFVKDENTPVSVRLTTSLLESDHPPSAAVEAACENWVSGCFDPIRRALDLDSKADATFYHFLDAEGQRLFDIYLSDYLVMGDGSQAWGRRFVASLYDWVIAQDRVVVPDRAYNLVLFERSRDPVGEQASRCLMNGKPWQAANEVMAQLDWPGEGPQLLRNFAVLKRLPTG